MKAFSFLGIDVPLSYLASSLPPYQLAELHRLMNEEVREVAVFFLDTQGIITVWNQAAEDMKGYTAEEAIGQPLAMLYTDKDQARGWPEHNLKKATEDGFYKEETWRKRKDGSLFWARIAMTALRESGGELVGFSKITMDLTDHKRLEQCVKEKEETRRILRAAKAGTWTWHPETDEIEVSESLLGLMGVKASSSTMTLDQWLSFVEPADRAKVNEGFAKARANGPDAPLTMELRMCNEQSDCRWFYVRADWYREKDDAPFALSGVNVDIQELKSAGEELQNAVEKLREADSRKDEFLTMLAHELRNPMAPIRSAAEVLKVASLDEARVRKMSEIIARQVDHMTNLVDDLLDVSRVTRGLVKLDMKPLDIRQIVTDAVEQIRPLARAKRHHLESQMASGTTMVMGDNKRLVQVLANLLNNAAKYTPDGGRIQLVTELQGANVMISVSDNGIGIEPELVGRVFDLFSQAETTPDRSSGGLGIGLALVKSLVELHHGTVLCASEGPGKGSKFSVLLPLVSTENSGTFSKSEQLLNFGKRLRIMIVDDNVDAAQTLGMLLEASGHEVMVEYDARTALDRARAESPDVCLLDIGLPEIDGNELAQRLVAQPETKSSVLVAVSGYGQEWDRRKAIASGFKHYLVKPVEPVRLLSLLAEIAN